MSINVEALTTIGLLPENLPPVFTSRNIWGHYAAFGSNYAVVKDAVGEHALYNASKRGGQRRLFSIPHPTFVRDQALFFEKHWSSIEPLLNPTGGSASTPQFSVGPRAVRITPHRALPKIKLRAFSRYRYCLVTDVARFFPSIYTHSIPWAVHGKEKSKLDTKYNSATVFANRLDFVSRQSQSRQTVGIPVGPDVSKLTSELIMCAVERAFTSKYGSSPPPYVRHVDDVWIGGDTHEDCERHLSRFRSALREFELDINELKTKVISTKYVFGDSWSFSFVDDIERSLRPGAQRSGLDPVVTLSKVVDASVEEGDDGIIRFVLKRMDEKRLWSLDWGLLEHFLAQCAVQFPHSFDYVARVVAWRSRTNGDIDRKLWSHVARVTVLEHASLGRDSEAIWALWLMKELGLRVPKAASEAILENCGALVLGFLAHFHFRRLCADADVGRKLVSAVEDDPFAGRRWPVALELNHLGISDPRWALLPAAPSLRPLYDGAATLINWSAPPPVFDSDETEGPDGGGGEPDYAIEDIAGEYPTEAWDEEQGEEETSPLGTEVADLLKDLL